MRQGSVTIKNVSLIPFFRSCKDGHTRRDDGTGGWCRQLGRNVKGELKGQICRGVPDYDALFDPIRKAREEKSGQLGWRSGQSGAGAAAEARGNREPAGAPPPWERCAEAGAREDRFAQRRDRSMGDRIPVNRLRLSEWSSTGAMRDPLTYEQHLTAAVVFTMARLPCRGNSHVFY